MPYFFAPDGRTVVAVRRNEETGEAIVLIDRVTLADVLTIPAGVRHGSVSPMALSPDGRRLVGSLQVFPGKKDASTWNLRLVTWDVASGRELASFAADEPKTFFSVTPAADGRTIAATTIRPFRDRTAAPPKLHLLNASTLALRRTVDVGNDLRPGHAAFRPDGRLLAVAAQLPNDGNPREWSAEDYPQPKVLLVDTTTGEVRATLVLPQCFCASLAFSPDGKTLAAGGLGQVLLFEVGDL
jgi:WD40 repeat protein